MSIFTLITPSAVCVNSWFHFRNVFWKRRTLNLMLNIVVREQGIRAETNVRLQQRVQVYNSSNIFSRKQRCLKFPDIRVMLLMCLRKGTLLLIFLKLISFKIALTNLFHSPMYLKVKICKFSKKFLKLCGLYILCNSFFITYKISISKSKTISFDTLKQNSLCLPQLLIITIAFVNIAIYFHFT